MSTSLETTALRRLGRGWRGWWKRVEVRLYRGLQQDTDVWTSKVFLWNKENQISQVQEFSTFYIWEDGSQASLKSLYASQLSEASPWVPSRLSVGSGHSLMAAPSQVLFSFLGILRAQKFAIGGPESLRAVTSLFTNIAGIFHFSDL